MAFYAVGWSGITVEPDPAFAGCSGSSVPATSSSRPPLRPRITTPPSSTWWTERACPPSKTRFAEVHSRSDYDVHDLTVTTRRMDSVLRDAGWEGKDIHFMSVDTEGSERAVLESIDLSTWRPWVLVVEATEPLTTESTRHLWEHIITGAGYQFCLFDGLSCFYVSEERSEELGPALSYPACALDDYMSADRAGLPRARQRRPRPGEERADESRALVAELIRWRGRPSPAGPPPWIRLRLTARASWRPCRPRSRLGATRASSIQSRWRLSDGAWKLCSGGSRTWKRRRRGASPSPCAPRAEWSAGSGGARDADDETGSGGLPALGDQVVAPADLNVLLAQGPPSAARRWPDG